ncbi:HAMP domain-containing histidine kinase [Microbacterium sp. KSW4-16]|uniref:histidine kinase n=1 Tax=Microbacterium aurugineum TaxID=2851642 RepID=A0ABY4IUN5_9MICO|nr:MULTISPECIES: HAMP domain-containing sensor histidine kinase [Microbacterium]MCK8468979.1 HAMP domain-containing histidine kinase [Microbacterium aurugineum]TCJ21422.1 HAMP domain-containing histidine kinase [Microbacterium sp. PI-1]UPL16500.1 HAMP domain-containing histidine kinase [Microbacterium aurugineum]
MPFADVVTIAAIALGWALLVGGAGLLALWLLRRRSLMLQLCIVILAVVLSFAAGVLAVAEAMYISPHDLLVVVVVTAISAVVAVAVAVLLAARLVRDARSLQRLTHSIGEGELLEDTGALPVNTEFARVAAELVSTSERLAAAREEVQLLDRSRRELIAWISHDLRSPLAGLRAMTEALDDGLAEDPARFHRQMRRQVDHMSDLVDNLFEVSKISSGTLTLRLEPMSLHDLVSDAVAELAPVARAKEVALVELTSPDHTVVGDARELARVMTNLLANAIEHTPAGGTIRIRTSREDDAMVLSVQDTGSGIAHENLTSVFEPGWRGTDARTPGTSVHGTSGAGLGLAIARGIVEAHNGVISAHNADGGSRFDIRLPVGA